MPTRPPSAKQKSNLLHAVCSSNTPRRQHRQCGATAPTPRPRRLMGLPPASLPIRSAPLPPGTCRRDRSNAPALTLHDGSTANAARQLQRPGLMGLPPATWPIRSAPLPPGTWRETVSQSRRLRIRHRDPLPCRPWSPTLPTHTPPPAPPYALDPSDEEPRGAQTTPIDSPISPVMANTCLPP